MNDFNKYMTAVLLSAVLSCSSEPKVAEIPITADPSVELGLVEIEVNKAAVNQVNVLAPKNFGLAVSSIDKAKTARTKNRNQKEILHDISLAKYYINTANEISQVSLQILPGVANERSNAIKAEAPLYLKEDFAKADKDLKKVTEAIEMNDTKEAVKKREGLKLVMLSSN